MVKKVIDGISFPESFKIWISEMIWVLLMGREEK